MDLFENSLHHRSQINVEHIAIRPSGWRISPWVAMSALQKAIRRDDEVFALRAASTLFATDPRRLWRRLLGICFEDVGFGAFDIVQHVVEVLSSNASRSRAGNDWSKVAGLVALLCSATKDRSSDDLLIAASNHPNLIDARHEIANLSVSEKLMRLQEPGSLLNKAMVVADLTPSRWKERSAPSVSAQTIWSALSAGGYSARYLKISEAGHRKTREVLPMMFALLSPSNSDETTEGLPEETRVVMLPNGVPGYALDMFSHEGKRALLMLLKSSTETARWFTDQIPPTRRRSVLGGLLFRVEGSVVNKRLPSRKADALRSLADNGFHRDPNIRIGEAADLLKADLETLHEFRLSVVNSSSV